MNPNASTAINFPAERPRKSFHVFGERVEILLSSEDSGGAAAVLTQTSPPGGGPPPHKHTYEDETFTVVHGEFEMFDGTNWHPLRTGEAFFARRGSVHTFRNVSSSDSTIMIFVAPGGFERYLEQLSPLSPATDMQEIVRISEQAGITFVG